MPFGLSCLNASMRGVVYTGTPFHMEVQDLPKPTIINQTDAIVRITTSAICGSDLHIYRGFMGGAPPWTMGHEAVGYVSEVGDAVFSHRVGDYVIIPDTITPSNLEMEPTATEYFGFGNSAMGLGGLQAEYARVPFSDKNLIPIPLTNKTTNPAAERDYLTVSDIFATGWAGLDYSGFQAGDTVAIFGAGPVGLLCAYSAILRGASKVYVVDHVQQRLELAASIGASPINFLEADPVAQILALEPGGVMRSVDCVGMEALDSRLERNAGLVVRQMVDVTHIGGGIGLLGVFKAQESSAGAPHGSNIAANIDFPISTFFGKALSFHGGAVDPKRYAPILIDLISSGKAHPGFVKSAVININDAASFYDRFYRQEEVKVIIQFPH